MEITSNGTLCGGEPTEVGFVMGNPGRPLTVFTDTNCDGENDAFVTIDTSKAGWAMFDAAGNYVGEQGYATPKRTYSALEFMIDRAWDDRWSFNATYTLSWSRGNAEGPVNSDTNFADAGRTEAFDDPWVNYGANGYLPNDRRHSLKMRGAYAFNDHWSVGATLSANSGRPISAFGTENPFDDTSYHSYFICTANCQDRNHANRTYELRTRGSQGRTPWLFDLGANVTFDYPFPVANLEVKLAVYNLLNQQRVTAVDEDLVSLDPKLTNADYGLGANYQAPRYALLTLKMDF